MTVPENGGFCGSPDYDTFQGCKSNILDHSGVAIILGLYAKKQIQFCCLYPHVDRLI